MHILATGRASPSRLVAGLALDLGGQAHHTARHGADAAATVIECVARPRPVAPTTGGHQPACGVTDEEEQLDIDASAPELKPLIGKRRLDAVEANRRETLRRCRDVRRPDQQIDVLVRATDATTKEVDGPAAGEPVLDARAGKCGAAVADRNQLETAGAMATHGSAVPRPRSRSASMATVCISASASSRPASR